MTSFITPLYSSLRCLFGASLLGFAACALAGCAPGQPETGPAWVSGKPSAGAFSLHPASAMVRLTGPTAIALPPEGATYKIEIPQGGDEAFQVLVKRNAASSPATTSPSTTAPAWSVHLHAASATFKSADNPVRLSLYQVLDVLNGTANPDVPAADEKLGWVPDVCLPVETTAVDSHRIATAQASEAGKITFLIDVHAPIAKNPGGGIRHYPYELQFADESGVRFLMLDVAVYPFALPVKLPFHTGVTWNWKIEQYLGRDLTAAERMAYFDFFLDYRFTPTNFFSRGPGFSEDEIRHILQRGGNEFQVFFQGGDGARLITDAQRKKLEPLVKQWRATMNSAGAGDICYALLADECKPAAYPIIRSNAAWLKSLWPEAKIWIASRPQVEMMDVADLWDVVVFASTPHYAPHSFTPESDAMARQSPRHPQLWWFYSKEPLPPHPNVRLDNNLVDARAIGAMSAARDMGGFEYTWATDWSHNKDLLNVPWPAKADNWNPGDADIGILCYPGDNGLPIPSLRLIGLRDAFEDWQLLKMAHIRPTDDADRLRDPKVLAALYEQACQKLSATK